MSEPHPTGLWCDPRHWGWLCRSGSRTAPHWAVYTKAGLVSCSRSWLPTQLGGGQATLNLPSPSPLLTFWSCICFQELPPGCGDSGSVTVHSSWRAAHSPVAAVLGPSSPALCPLHPSETQSNLLAQGLIGDTSNQGPGVPIRV